MIGLANCGNLCGSSKRPVQRNTEGDSWENGDGALNAGIFWPRQDFRSIVIVLRGAAVYVFWEPAPNRPFM
jgi:hypothetical protein